nr:hypothetical protein [Prevotella sp.]
MAELFYCILIIVATRILKGKLYLALAEQSDTPGIKQHIINTGLQAQIN